MKTLAILAIVASVGPLASTSALGRKITLPRPTVAPLRPLRQTAVPAHVLSTLQRIAGQLQTLIRSLQSSGVRPATGRPAIGVVIPRPVARPVSSGGWTAQMTAFLRQNKKHFTERAYRTLLAIARRGDQRAFMAEGKKLWQKGGGFPCDTHQVLHDCNTHCDLMHTGLGSVLRPACRAGCKIDNRLFKPAFRVFSSWLNSAKRAMGNMVRRAGNVMKRAAGQVLKPFRWSRPMKRR